MNERGIVNQGTMELKAEQRLITVNQAVSAGIEIRMVVEEHLGGSVS